MGTKQQSFVASKMLTVTEYVIKFTVISAVLGFSVVGMVVKFSIKVRHKFISHFLKASCVVNKLLLYHGNHEC